MNVGREGVGLEAEGLLVAGDGVIELTLLREGSAVPDVVVGVVWLEAEGLAVAGRRFGGPAQRVVGLPEQAPGEGIGGIRLDDLAAERLRLEKITGLVTFRSGFERGCKCVHE